MAAPPTDYDSPWKEALAHYLPDFLRLLLPALHQQIDWSHPPVFLDKELQAITRDAANARRIADKLVLVHLRRTQQRDILLLIHIEVQGDQVTARTLVRMGARMYQYFYRISDRYLSMRFPRSSAHVPRESAGVPRGSPRILRGSAGMARGEAKRRSADHTDKLEGAELFSLCVLTASTGGAPTLTYTQGFESYGVQFSCPVVHLAEWLDQWNALEQQAKTNPFAVIVMAQLMAQQTHGKGTERLASKTRIVRLLYQYRYSRTDVLQLLRLIDWLMILPTELEPLFDQAVDMIEQENKMAFVTSFERLSEQRGIERGIEKGIEKGLLQGKQEGESTLLQRQLTRKFGILPDAITHCIQNATSAQLETWSLNILDATSLDEVFTD